MPTFDKNSRTFHLVNRPSHDPKNYLDTEDGGGGIFVEQKPKNVREEKKSRVVGRKQLEQMRSQFAGQGMRDNEGEAANYGITFDDSTYDYMQHLKPIGTDPNAYFITKEGKITESYKPPEAKDKLMLADLLNGERDKLEEPTFYEKYQSMLPVQDSLKQLRPDMDPRLQEVLEALEDEEYVDPDLDADEMLFSELIQTGVVKDEEEWKNTNQIVEQISQRDDEEDWEFAFRQFKLEKKPQSDGSLSGISEEFDTVGDLPKIKPQRKKKIGANTDLSSYSMTSSANYRNEGLTLLDDKFDKVEEEYLKESSEEEEEFDMSKERQDLESIMDDFLDGYVVEGKRLYKRTK